MESPNHIYEEKSDTHSFDDREYQWGGENGHHINRGDTVSTSSIKTPHVEQSSDTYSDDGSSNGTDNEDEHVRGDEQPSNGHSRYVPPSGRPLVEASNRDVFGHTRDVPSFGIALRDSSKQNAFHMDTKSKHSYGDDQLRLAKINEQDDDDTDADSHDENEDMLGKQADDAQSFGGALLNLIKQAQGNDIFNSSFTSDSGEEPKPKKMRQEPIEESEGINSFESDLIKKIAETHAEEISSIRKALSERRKERNPYEEETVIKERKSLGFAYNDEGELASFATGDGEHTAYLCPVCDRSFHMLHDLSVHIQTHTADKAHHCDECGKSFGQRMDLERHEMVHFSDTPYLCAMCQERFTCRADLFQHLETHRDVKIYKCDLCDETFLLKMDLSKHSKTHVLVGDKPGEVIVRDQTYDFKAHMQYLNTKHVRGTSYDCTMCERKFTQKVHLQRHILTHTGEKPYECSYCSKKFAQKSTLQRHEISHTGIKLFKCLLCDKSFAQGSDLTRHNRVHTGEKPYQCDVCDKYFTQAGVLQRHKLTHDKKNPNQCLLCQAMFTSKKALMNHARTHTEITTLGQVDLPWGNGTQVKESVDKP